MPSYNHARYLPRALDAIFAQSLQPREVVVVDDASRDNSVEVLDAYARRFPHLRIIRSEKNLGVVGAMNRGAQLASADSSASRRPTTTCCPGSTRRPSPSSSATRTSASAAPTTRPSR